MTLSSQSILASALVLLATLGMPLVTNAEEAEERSEEEAKPRATASRALAVWGPSNVSGGAAISKDILELRLPEGDPFPSRILRLSDWLEAPEFQISGNAEAVACAAAAPDIVVPDGKTELSQLTASGLALLDDLEPASALETFSLAAQRLPCQEGFLSTEAIARLSFYTGIAAYMNGDVETASNQFRQSAAIDPAQPWDASYPTEPQSTFLSAVQEIVAAPKARVYGDMRGTAYVEVWLDGQRLDLDKAIERELLPGTHVIQALDDGSNWHSFVYRLESGGKLLLFSSRGLEHTMLDGPDGELSTLATSILRERGAEQLLTELYVLKLHPEDPSAIQVRGFDPRTGVWSVLRAPLVAAPEEPSPTPAPAPTPAVTQAPPPPVEVEKPLTKKEKAEKELLRDPRYRSGAVAGFKLFQLQRCSSDEVAEERCPNGTKAISDYIGGTVLIDIRIIKGLNLDIRLGMTATDLKEGGTLLPEVGIGMKYRFLTGSIQPYLGGGADFFAGTTRESIYDSTNTVVIYGGIQGFGGVDFEFSDGFRLTFEGGAGAIINPDQGSAAWLDDDGGSEAWPMGHFIVGLGRFL